jgi:hypothetical protein
MFFSARRPSVCKYFCRMNPLVIVAIILAFVIAELTIVLIIVRSTLVGVSDVLVRFPKQEPLPAAERRRFQGLSFGLVNLGWCFHLAADVEWLHIEPAWLARRLGVRAASVPWSELGPIGGRLWWRSGVIAGDSFKFPIWCARAAGRERTTRDHA